MNISYISILNYSLHHSSSLSSTTFCRFDNRATPGFSFSVNFDFRFAVSDGRVPRINCDADGKSSDSSDELRIVRLGLTGRSSNGEELRSINMSDSTTAFGLGVDFVLVGCFSIIFRAVMDEFFAELIKLPGRSDKPFVVLAGALKAANFEIDDATGLFIMTTWKGELGASFGFGFWKTLS